MSKSNDIQKIDDHNAQLHTEIDELRHKIPQLESQSVYLETKFDEMRQLMQMQFEDRRKDCQEMRLELDETNAKIKLALEQKKELLMDRLSLGEELAKYKDMLDKNE